MGEIQWERSISEPQSDLDSGEESPYEKGECGEHLFLC